MEHPVVSYHLLEHRFRLLVVLNGAFQMYATVDYSNSSLNGVTHFDRDPVGRSQDPIRPPD